MPRSPQIQERSDFQQCRAEEQRCTARRQRLGEMLARNVEQQIDGRRKQRLRRQTVDVKVDALELRGLRSGRDGDNRQRDAERNDEASNVNEV